MSSNRSRLVRWYLKFASAGFFLALAAGASDEPSLRLSRLVEQYFDELLELRPLQATYDGDHRFDDRLTVEIAPEHRRQALELETRFLAQIEDVDSGSLDSADRLTREIFIHCRRQAIEAYRFPDHLLPVDHLQSLPVLLAVMGAGGSVQPFETVKDYENWLERLAGWRPWVEQAILNLRRGIETGVVMPRVLVERTLPLLDDLVEEDARRSVFFGPIERLPATIEGSERKRLELTYISTIRDQVVPGYHRLGEFLREIYLPETRTSVGLSDLPGGPDWYAFLVRAHTATELEPEEIHRIGRREVARITTLIRRVQSRPWIATPGVPSGSEPLLDGYTALRKRVEPKLTDLFRRKPSADFEIRSVEAFRRRSAPGASYVAGSPDGSRLGRFYVNVAPETRGSPSEALFLHEAIPGHHFQISMQRELDHIPRFRRFGHFAAYSEGWALYAESLGEELGLYRTRDQKLRALGSELFRARRLVVDTGLHAMGWSRQRAIDYLGSEREVDRYIAWPGQALAYKIGELRISELRANAEKRLGKGFDIRGFHDVVLGEGAMPLDVLERRVETWVDAQGQ